ncbi:MAG TPA: TolC family protein [Thermoanaerobaculia bacterium]
MKRGLILIVLTGLLPFPAAADDLTLRAAVERALAKFPSVAAARAQQREAQEGLAAEKGSRGPRGALNGWATQYQKPTLVSPIHSFKPSEIPDFDRTILQGQLSASYTLWDGGATGARIAVAGSQVGGAEAALGAAEQDLAERVASAYLTALGKARTLAAHDQRLAALEAELARAQKLLDAGKAPQVEVIRAEANLAGARSQRVSLAAALDNAERDLARLLDAPVEETRAPRLAPERLKDPAPPDREALARAAIEKSPAVAQARAQLALAEANVNLALSALRPELRAMANVNDWASSKGHAAAEWNAGLQVTVPLFDGGTVRRRIAQAEAGRAAAAEQVRLAEAQVREAVDRAAAAAEEAQARIESLARAADRYAEVARVQKLLLDNGAGTQTDYLAAEADLLTARASLAEGEQAVVLTRVDLARAAGRLTLDWLSANLETPPLETRP